MSSSSGGGDHDDGPHEEHEEHVNHEAWVIPYADLLTLLMAMFIALFSISNVDAQKFRQMADSFNKALRVGSGNSATVIDLGGAGEIFAQPLGEMLQAAVDAAATAAAALANPEGIEAAALTIRTLAQAVEDAETKAGDELKKVEEIINDQAAQSGFSASLRTTIDARGLVITVITDVVVFASGSADLGRGGATILGVVGRALGTVDNRVLVEGHTDNMPIRTAAYPSNWELSTARAGAVLRFFEADAALPTGRMQAAGFADTRPIESNATETGRARNRRVEVIVESDAQQIKNRILEEAAQASTRLQRTDSTR